jgi:hypothetical protein
MMKLPKASRLKRKQMGKAQHKITSVGPKGENVGRALALKKRYTARYSEISPALTIGTEI